LIVVIYFAGSRQVRSPLSLCSFRYYLPAFR